MTDHPASGPLLTIVSDRSAQTWEDKRAGDDSLVIGQAARQVLAAHLVELRQAEVIEDEAFRLIAGALASFVDGEPAIADGGTRLLTGIEEMVEGRLPAAVRGVVTLGLAREEWGATVERMAWRHAALRIGFGAAQVMARMLELASVHAVTVMPAHAGGRPVQPTTFSHFLGGAIEPLRDQGARLRETFGRINRSPLGSGLLVGNALGADRDDIAQRLGFGSALPNTFDAVAGIEAAVEVVDVAMAVLAIVERFLSEIAAWHRTDPTSFLVDERWLSRPEPAQPALEIPSRLDDLIAAIAHATGALDGNRRELRDVAYGPVANRRMRRVADAGRISTLVSVALGETTTFLAEGLIVNRAYLGNRAGRNMVTGGDLAFFLISEENIAPPAALEITSLVLARLKDSNLEVSGITQDMIDSAALLTIGREIKVEMESLGRYLAPRRYLERRQVTGSAAPAMTREWLDDAASAHRQHHQWLDHTGQGIRAALDALDGLIFAASGESPDD